MIDEIQKYYEDHCTYTLLGTLLSVVINLYNYTNLNNDYNQVIVVVKRLTSGRYNFLKMFCGGWYFLVIMVFLCSKV